VGLGRMAATLSAVAVAVAIPVTISVSASTVAIAISIAVSRATVTTRSMRSSGVDRLRRGDCNSHSGWTSLDHRRSGVSGNISGGNNGRGQPSGVIQGMASFAEHWR
jgi:hypothetical protein